MTLLSETETLPALLTAFAGNERALSKGALDRCRYGRRVVEKGRLDPFVKARPPLDWTFTNG